MKDQLSEKHESLWWLAASPLIWAAHFLLCYVTAAVWCAKLASAGASLSTVRVAMVIYTVMALLGVCAIGWRGFRRHRLARAPLPHDADTAKDRHRFLGFATMLLSGLSFIAICYAALPAAFIRSCS
jgi:hypothetical protein